MHLLAWDTEIEEFNILHDMYYSQIFTDQTARNFLA